MLVLGRRVGEKIVIDVPAGEARRIEVMLVKLTPEKIRIGIEADRDVNVWRDELTAANEPTAAA